MRARHVSIAVSLASVSVFALPGCGERPPGAGSQRPDGTESHASPDDHQDVAIGAEDVERPADYRAGVQRIIAYRSKIRDEIAAGRPGKAHRPLDEANIVLEWIPELARDSGVPKQDWEAVNTTAQRIRGLLDQVHASIDKGEEPDFASIAPGLQESIDRLLAIEESGSGESSSGEKSNVEERSAP